MVVVAKFDLQPCPPQRIVKQKPVHSRLACRETRTVLKSVITKFLLSTSAVQGCTRQRLEELVSMRLLAPRNGLLLDG